MRYCSNDQCVRKETCLRYQLGIRFNDPAEYRVNKKRPGVWVAYRNNKECDKCTQYIDDG